MPVNLKGGNEFLNPPLILNQHLNLVTGETVADLGCGSMGFFSIAAAKIVGPNGRVFAVDVLKEVLSSVAGRVKVEGLDNVETIWSNLEIYGATKIPEQSLDAAFLINILFQAKKHYEIIKEAYRLLKPGGRLLVIDWKMLDTPFGPVKNIRVSPNKIKEFATLLHLIKTSEFEAGNFHYGLIFIK